MDKVKKWMQVFLSVAIKENILQEDILIVLRFRNMFLVLNISSAGISRFEY